MTTKALTLQIPFISKISTKLLFFVLSAMLLSIFALYFYFVNKTIMNVVARESIQRNIASLSGGIGELEFKYISLKNNVTLDLAHAQGFQDVSGTKFLARNQKSTTLTYNYAR